jgi:ankyrin repeat protein
VKILNILIAAVGLGAIAAPAGAQYVNPQDKFVQAVKDRDGTKAMEALNDSPTGVLNARDGEGNTPLLIAIARSDGEWTPFLISKGADVNLPGKGGDTPLIAAARVGYLDAVEWLLKAGAQVDQDNRMGETPLIVAVQQRQLPIVKLLLDVGANPDKPDSAAGYSARDYATRDTRSRRLLQMIEAKKPKPTSAAAR